MAEESIIDWAVGIKDRLAYELKNGGSEELCPFCGLPRCQRSDYIRCVRCGINWLDGEDLDIDPRMYRMRRQAPRLGAAKEMPEVQ